MRTLRRTFQAGAVAAIAALDVCQPRRAGPRRRARRAGRAGARRRTGPWRCSGRPGAVATPPPTGRAGAPIDLTGYWVSVITEDWRWRMVTPPRGDYASVPINMDAKKVADAWDPAKDEAAGEPCKAYGAPGLMRQPTRLQHHLAGRQHDEGRGRRRHADASLPLRRLEGAGRRADAAGRHDGAVGDRRARPRRQRSRRRCSAT